MKTTSVQLKQFDKVTGECIACDSFDIEYTGSLDDFLAARIEQFAHLQNITTTITSIEGDATAVVNG